MEQKKTFKRLIVIAIFILILMVLPAFTNKVNAMTIVIDPGHGGNDPGASYGGIRECDMTMAISNYLKEYLSEYSDVNVMLTHNGNTMSLNDRADFARGNKADLLISIHINSSESHSPNGVEAYVTYRTELPKYHEQMYNLANLIVRNISNLRNT